jgi:hypothetical protein
VSICSAVLSRCRYGAVASAVEKARIAVRVRGPIGRSGRPRRRLRPCGRHDRGHGVVGLAVGGFYSGRVELRRGAPCRGSGARLWCAGRLRLRAARSPCSGIGRGSGFERSASLCAINPCCRVIDRGCRARSSPTTSWDHPGCSESSSAEEVRGRFAVSP